MSNIIIKTANPTEMTPIQRAITAELKRLEWSYEQTRQRLESFEQKYHCSSGNLVNLAAEDLAGCDLEYVQWAGEYQFFLDLAAQIKCLKDIVSQNLPEPLPKTAAVKLSMQEIAKLPIAERHKILAPSISATAADFLNDPELTEFSVLDGEAWELEDESNNSFILDRSNIQEVGAR